MRVQVNQHGDFTLIGNTLGQECAAGTPAPVVGALGNCGSNTDDSGPDLFWRSDSPADGQAEANTGIAMAQARSTAVLSLPTGAQVTHAYLYWSAFLASGSDTSVTLDRPGANGFSATITALDSLTASSRYRSVADVTALVQAHGEGAYRISDVTMTNWINLSNANVFGAWWMVVLYRLDSEPLRNLTIYDGLDGVSGAAPQNITLSGFLVPPGQIDGKLGVVTLDGDNVTTGDSLTFNGTTLFDGQNPANNFFNSTRSRLGSAVTVAGDLPQLAGEPQSMSGIDLDIVDVSPYLTSGQTSAPIGVSTSSDVFFLATFVTSITTFQPELGLSTKRVADLNGGALLPGDTLEYTIAITNTGNETATLTLLDDPLPQGITYQPGSLRIGGVAQSDASGDDQAEYTNATRTIRARLGVGADAAQGGTLAIGAATEVRFRATLDASCSGPVAISNQGTLSATSQSSARSYTFQTDGDSVATGSQPTTLTVNFRCLTVARTGTGTGTITDTPGGLNCGVSCQAVVPDGTTITLQANPSPGSTFSGWSGALGGTTNPVGLTLNANQAVTATFTLNTYTITPTAGLNGSISPNTVQTIGYGGTQTFTITPNSGYRIADVLVDGVSVGPLGTYTFSNVAANHTIAATFEAIQPTPTYTPTPTNTPASTPTPTGTPTVPRKLIYMPVVLRQ
ncbi:MAG: hypothetical protein OHK0022_17040 [Roseiflexaceae bacterium]